MPITPPIEPITITRPPRWARIAGSTACVTRTTPQKLVSSWARASASGVCSTAPAMPQPAASTTAPMRPSSASTRSTPSVTDPSTSTSITRPVHPVDAVPRRLAPTTVHPAPASRSAQARPMPADAPVTSTTRSTATGPYDAAPTEQQFGDGVLLTPAPLPRDQSPEFRRRASRRSRRSSRPRRCRERSTPPRFVLPRSGRSPSPT